MQISKPIRITKEIFEKFENGDNKTETIGVCQCPVIPPNVLGTGKGHILKKDVTYVCSECGTVMCCPSKFDYNNVAYPDN